MDEEFALEANSSGTLCGFEDLAGFFELLQLFAFLLQVFLGIGNFGFQFFCLFEDHLDRCLLLPWFSTVDWSGSRWLSFA